MLVHSISFKVKGTTLKNEENKEIQKEIKKVLKEYKENDYFDELYGGYTSKEIKEMDLNISEYDGYSFPAKLIGDKYNGEDCLKIYIKTYNDEYIHLGYAPKEELDKIAEWITKEEIKIDGKMKITGGKYKYCELYEEDYEEKERVVTEELTYGLEVTLNFYDNKVEQNTYNNENNIQKNIDIEKVIPYIVTIIISIPFIWLAYKIFSFFIWLFT